MKATHRTKDGKEIAISAMGDGHLVNTIRLLGRRAKEGLVVRRGGGSCPDDFWYDEETLYGDEAREALGYAAYAKEAAKRGLAV